MKRYKIINIAWKLNFENYKEMSLDWTLTLANNKCANANISSPQHFLDVDILVVGPDTV